MLALLCAVLGPRLGAEARVDAGPRFRIVVPGGTYHGPLGPVMVTDVVLGEVGASALSDSRVGPALLRACIREALRATPSAGIAAWLRVLRGEKRRSLARVRRSAREASREPCSGA